MTRRKDEDSYVNAHVHLHRDSKTVEDPEELQGYIVREIIVSGCRCEHLNVFVKIVPHDDHEDCVIHFAHEDRCPARRAANARMN